MTVSQWHVPPLLGAIGGRVFAEVPMTSINPDVATAIGLVGGLVFTVLLAIVLDAVQIESSEGTEA